MVRVPDGRHRSGDCWRCSWGRWRLAEPRGKRQRKKRRDRRAGSDRRPQVATTEGIVSARRGLAGTRCAAGLGPAAHRRSLRLGRAPTPRPHNGPEDPDHGSRDKVRGKLGHKPMSCDNHQVMHGFNLLLWHPAGALEGLSIWSWDPEPVLAGHLQPSDTGRAGSAASPVAL